MNLPEQLRIDRLEYYFNWTRNFPVSSVQFLVGCAVFATFFICVEANLREYGSYSLHFCMFRYISVSFASYLLQNIRTDLHTNIRFDAKNTCCSEYSLQSEYLLMIFSYWRIFAPKYSFRSVYLQNYKPISHLSEYSLTNIRIQGNVRYMLLQIL